MHQISRPCAFEAFKSALKYLFIKDKRVKPGAFLYEFFLKTYQDDVFSFKMVTRSSLETHLSHRRSPHTFSPINCFVWRIRLCKIFLYMTKRQFEGFLISSEDVCRVNILFVAEHLVIHQNYFCTFCQILKRWILLITCIWWRWFPWINYGLNLKWDMVKVCVGICTQVLQ